MKFGVVGTGVVGRTLASKLVALGHEVMIGSRSKDNPEALSWARGTGDRGKAGTFGDAARFGEILINCTQGAVSVNALRMIPRGDLKGKVLIDVANPLDLSGEMPPGLTICNRDSLGESIQREFPEAKVVKALNTCNCEVMVNPGRVNGKHDIFLCGNDAQAKEQVKQLLRDFGWESIIDLGGISSARATEQLMPIWLRLYGLYKTADFNFRIVRN